MAPDITPSPSKAPIQVVFGNKMSAEAINSTTPDPILPQGSMPTVEKIYTDSSDAVNLKNSVPSMMMAAIKRSTHIPIEVKLSVILFG